MNDGNVQVSTVVTTGSWLVAFGLLLAGWVEFFTGHPDAATMLGLTGIVVAAVAATTTVRRYVVRMCVLVRALYGISAGREEPESGVRPIR